jgi:hypothetical protein
MTELVGSGKALTLWLRTRIDRNDRAIADTKNPSLAAIEGFINYGRAAVLGNRLDDDFCRVSDAQFV